ncbi:MAG TPA: FliI/YscN family ATPase [Candidatus Hydrogenedentes bacterium]|nr:FliI/YscN family ATPase [Candidatus Hydrogenedentota bacterium]HOL78038.1 FliI/YscN family ATPase [Candidatus Hydrogenedentota bacterium]HPO84603.1 FliI/YscN family ATPase [Candidatus Hydrogenedentota bacterium]
MNNPRKSDLAEIRQRVFEIDPIEVYGKISGVSGLTIEATGPSLRIGDLCYVENRATGQHVPVEVVGFRNSRLLLMAYGDMNGISPGSLLLPTHKPQRVPVGPELLGRVVGSNGMPIDGGPPIRSEAFRALIALPPAPLGRRRITEPLATGIRAIDACVTCGKGQRMGIMSGSGVGKSKMIGMIARNTNADINVIALIGERGREVREFIEGDLGEEGLARSIVVVATSDEPALSRIRGAYAALTVAEWFRDQGADVLFMMDSITRLAMAQREVGLAVGEPPTTKGYPPSVYGMLSRFLERAGTSACGSITGIYAILVEADDINDPVGDAVRSFVDGHVVLSRNLASRNHYPAIDVLESVSRCMVDVTTPEHQELAGRIRRILATYREAEDLVNIGAYAAGSNREIDEALRLMPNIRAFLQQGLFEKTPYDEIVGLMRQTLRGT